MGLLVYERSLGLLDQKITKPGRRIMHVLKNEVSHVLISGNIRIKTVTRMSGI